MCACVSPRGVTSLGDTVISVARVCDTIKKVSSVIVLRWQSMQLPTLSPPGPTVKATKNFWWHGMGISLILKLTFLENAPNPKVSQFYS